ncbi:hypothetical protein KZZ07_00190 [Mameliella sp. CS4]|uniref:hypothetical protein n=1 Tax=Mameliella sp. CS4 TaxID=2862329 RepID=UPI001C5F55D3|nr:hypothetical protein [Mameliella sp. CS4]MBW4980944.1 hypothetical protein [Mameliella sp. CS4]
MHFDRIEVLFSAPPFPKLISRFLMQDPFDTSLEILADLLLCMDAMELALTSGIGTFIPTTSKSSERPKRQPLFARLALGLPGLHATAAACGTRLENAPASRRTDQFAPRKNLARLPGPAPASLPA